MVTASAGRAWVAVDSEYPGLEGQRDGQADPMAQPMGKCDGLVQLTHRPDRIPSQCQRHRRERQGAHAWIMVAVQKAARMVNIRAVDGAPLVRGKDALFHASTKHSIHPLCVQRLQPQRVIALRGQVGHPVDQARGAREVTPVDMEK